MVYQKNAKKAKTSPPKFISAANHPSVRRGVEEDLRTILRKPSQNDSHRWNHVPRDDSKTSERFDPKRIRMPGRGLSFLRKKDKMVVRRMPREEGDVYQSPPKKAYEHLDLLNHFNDIVSAAGITCDQPQVVKPTVSKSKVRFNVAQKAFEFDDSEDEMVGDRAPLTRGFREPSQRANLPTVNATIEEDDSYQIPLRVDDESDEDIYEEVIGTPVQERGFSLLDSNVYTHKEYGPLNPKVPEKLPMKDVVNQTSQSLPKLTLRNGDSLTYSQLVSDVCRKVVHRRNDSKSKEDIRFDSSAFITTMMSFDKLQ